MRGGLKGVSKPFEVSDSKARHVVKSANKIKLFNNRHFVLNRRAGNKKGTTI